jgi:hypothetical protein
MCLFFRGIWKENLMSFCYGLLCKYCCNCRLVLKNFVILLLKPYVKYGSSPALLFITFRLSPSLVISSFIGRFIYLILFDMETSHKCPPRAHLFFNSSIYFLVYHRPTRTVFLTTGTILGTAFS